MENSFREGEWDVPANHRIGRPTTKRPAEEEGETGEQPGGKLEIGWG